MRRVVLIAWLSLSGCFYEPTVAECAVACTDRCPGAMQCIEGLCRTSLAVSCECQNGVERACGVTRGACKEGTQRCAAGAWGACEGEVTPSAETCDGVDNDCDGQIDVFGAVVLHDRPVSAWRFVPLDGGFAVVVLSEADAGEFATTVTRLDETLQPVDSTVARVGGGYFGGATSIDQTVYLAFDVDGGVEALGVTGSTVTAFDFVGDAGVRQLLRVGAGDGRLVAHWDVPGQVTTQLARWSLDGRLIDLTALSTLDSGIELLDGYAPALSSTGRYAIFTAAEADAGSDDPIRLVVDTRTLEVVRADGAYYQYDALDSKQLELPQGGLAGLYTYQYPSSSWSGIYLNPDLLRFATSQEIAVEEVMSSATAWGSSDMTLDGEGRVSFVYMDNVRQQLVLARMPAALDPLSAPLRQSLPSTFGFGVPRIAYPGRGEFVSIAWYDRARLQARRVCPAK